MKRPRVASLVAALVACVAVSSVAEASVYNLSALGVSRTGLHGSDYGYWGPRFSVSSWGTSVDEYLCPSGQTMSNYVVAPEDRRSEREWTEWASDYGNRFYVHVTWFGPWQDHPPISLRVAASCTNNPVEFRRNYGVYSYSAAYWDGVLKADSPSAADYGELVKRVFCWSSTYPGCGTNAVAPKRAGRFALHDGNDTVTFWFKAQSLTLPPAVRLTEPAGCRAQRMRVSVEQRLGSLGLILRCHGLKRGGLARLRIARLVRRSFRVRQGTGSIQVRLAKPPGSVEPLAYVGYGRADTPCGIVRRRLSLRLRTFVARVSARCGGTAGNAVAHLYIGGLLR